MARGRPRKSKTDGDNGRESQGATTGYEAELWPPDARLSMWLLERKWPEKYSRKHIEVSPTVKSEDPSPPMRLIVIDQVETPPVPVGENEKGPEPDAPAPEADTPGLAGEDDD